MCDSILRSSSGVYHIGSGNASNCNGRSGKFNKTSVELALKAKPESFCKKCFGSDPNKRIEYRVRNGLLK